MNKKLITLLAGVLFCSFIFTSCDDDTEYSEKPVSAELKAVLEQQEGIVFNELGQLEMNGAVQNLTSLDLNGAKLTDYSELTILPSLTDLKFSKCDLGTTFDFSVLPAQITGVDLTGNKIYEYKNLVKVEVAENGEETVTTLRKFAKLLLPVEAKDNMTDLMYYYRDNKSAIENGELEMKMADAKGSLSTYSTLRNIPDATLRAFMKDKFSDVFVGDQLDITKHIGIKQNTTAFTIGSSNSMAVKNPTSLDGVQYILNSPYYKGTMFVARLAESLELPRVSFPESVSMITMENVTIEGTLDINYGTIVTLIKINGLKKIDFSKSKIFGQRGYENEGKNMFGSYLKTYDCPDLEEIKFPEVKDLKANWMDVECMPKLKDFSLKNFNMIVNIQIGDLNEKCNLVYPNLTEFFKDPLWGARPTNFSISESTYNRQETKDFIKKFYTDATENRLVPLSRLSCSKNKGYVWYK